MALVVCNRGTVILSAAKDLAGMQGFAPSHGILRCAQNDRSRGLCSSPVGSPARAKDAIRLFFNWRPRFGPPQQLFSICSRPALDLSDPFFSYTQRGSDLLQGQRFLATSEAKTTRDNLPLPLVESLEDPLHVRLPLDLSRLLLVMVRAGVRESADHLRVAGAETASMTKRVRDCAGEMPLAS